MYTILLSAFSLLLCSDIQAQRKIHIHGTILDVSNDQPVEFVTVAHPQTRSAVNTNEKGVFSLRAQVSNGDSVVFRRTGYHPYALLIPFDKKDWEIHVKLTNSSVTAEVVVTDRKIEDAGVVREKVEAMKLLPSTTGNLESLLPHIALGTTSGTGGELTSQYTVRGGNYDENLVYVNDFEIYRPLLIRTGNQEGLTFPNLDLIRDISFASGGFESRYGDKLSSVLDVRYKLPDTLRGSVSGGLLGASAHVEGSVKVGKDSYKKWRFLAGVRYKSNAYLLGSLDVKGEYSPTFTDYQVYSTLDLSRDWQIAVMGNLSRNRYDFIPVSSSTASGLVTFALKLTTLYEGAERDFYVNGMGGVSLSYVPENVKNPFFAKLLFSGYRSLEREEYDIIGAYRLSQIETDINDPDAGQEVALLGDGVQHLFTRNLLQVGIFNTDIRTGLEIETRPGISHFLQAGLRIGFESVNDRVHEWERLDSAGFSLPYVPDELKLLYTLDSERDLQTMRLSGFMQNTFTRQFEHGKELKITGGVRLNYWNLNDELLISPRIQLLYAVSHESSIRFATGIYAQPAFYRELRRPDGSINEDLRAQKSFHVVGGYSFGFGPRGTSGTKYKLILEGYYKSLWDQVSYEVDNVRIRYSGENDASGYIAGLDVRLNGELVPGAESWVNISFLHARERILGVQHLKREVGVEEGVPVNTVPRPTDQFMTLNMFFQDYLPNNENFRVHLNMGIGTGLPFGIKDNNRIYRNTYRYKPYHRVDIGFSLNLWDAKRGAMGKKSIFGFSRQTWISLEIFNLLQVRNEASRSWIKTIFLTQYSIPNYLSSRRLNIRFRCDF